MNAILEENTFYWEIPYPFYKIQSVYVVTDQNTFIAKYSCGVSQYLENGRIDDTCPSIFQGRFSVYFTKDPLYQTISDIQSIQINIIQA